MKKSHKSPIPSAKVEAAETEYTQEREEFTSAEFSEAVDVARFKINELIQNDLTLRSFGQATSMALLDLAIWGFAKQRSVRLETLLTIIPAMYTGNVRESLQKDITALLQSRGLKSESVNKLRKAEGI